MVSNHTVYCFESGFVYTDRQSHNCRADKNPYRHDGRADKDTYRHDRRAYSLSRGIDDENQTTVNK